MDWRFLTICWKRRLRIAGAETQRGYEQTAQPLTYYYSGIRMPRRGTESRRPQCKRKPAGGPGEERRLLNLPGLSISPVPPPPVGRQSTGVLYRVPTYDHKLISASYMNAIRFRRPTGDTISSAISDANTCRINRGSMSNNDRYIYIYKMYNHSQISAMFKLRESIECFRKRRINAMIESRTFYGDVLDGETQNNGPYHT